MLVAVETFNIFLLTGISNINIFFKKKKNNVVVTNKTNYYFASKLLTYNIKKKHYRNKFILKKHNRFPFERIQDVCPLPGPGQNRPLPFLFPQHIQIEDDLLNCGHCPVVSLSPYKHIDTVISNFVLARHLQRVESFVTDITGVNPLSLFLVLCPPTLFSSSDNMIFLTNLPSTPAEPVTGR